MAAATGEAVSRRQSPAWTRLPSMGLVVGVVTVLLALLVLYPLVTTLVRVLLDPEQLRLAEIDSAVPGMLANTAIVVLFSAALALLVGSVFAWLNERTDASLRAVGEMLPLAPLLTPPLAGVIGLVVLFEPRAGLVNGWLRALLGAVGISTSSGPINLYTLPGLVAVTALYLVPYVYLVVSTSLRKLDPSLEEASRLNRAGPLRTLVCVTLPAIKPSLIAAGLLAVISALGLFSVPVVIGTGARVEVLSVYIFRLLENFPPKTGSALILAALLLVLVQALLFAQRWLAPAGRHAAVGGRGFRTNPVLLGRLRPWARGMMVLYLLVTAILPLAGLVFVSLQPFWTPAVQWDRLSLNNYKTVLIDTRATSQALLNSLGLGAATATIVMLAAGLLMLYVHQARGRGRRFVDVVTSLPATFPHTIIGVSVLVAFSRPPLPLYGTVGILLVAYLIMGLPYAARAASAATDDIGLELVEASRVFRASERRTFVRILLPIALPGLAAGWIIVFVTTAGELTASVLLSSTGNPVLGRVMIDLWAYGSYPQVTALAVIITALNGVFVAIMLRVARRTLSRAVA
ncbi:MAG: iron ABC transporter permease [Chloroflexi bacterium]|nr:iron ABC transporter permease [Chloroflexota bacterium]